jgi:hypothetical protein
MNQTTPIPGAARSARILHLALVVGLALVGAVFFLLDTLSRGRLNVARIPSVAFAALSIIQIVVALGWFRQRIPQRSFNQSPDGFWSSNDVRSASIVLWALLEGAGLFSWVGYLLTGGILPAAASILALLLLVGVRPSRLEADGAA